MENSEKSSLEIDRQAFKAILPDLLKTHAGKYALVRDQKLEGVFDSIDSAYAEGLRRFGLRPFFVGHIVAVEKPEQLPALTHGLIHAHL